MERLIDKAVLLFACIACMAAVGMQADERTDALGVGVVLACVALSALFEAIPRNLRGGAVLLFSIVSLLAPTGMFVLPLALYDSARGVYDGGTARLAPAAPIAAFLIPCVAGMADPPKTLVCLAAMVGGFLLSVRTSRMTARFEILNRMHDDLASRARQLGFRTEALEGELAEARRRVPAEPRTAPTESDIRPSAFRVLTDREFEVARLVADGMENREIAASAYMSEGTVRNHISSILAKMALKNRTQIAVEYWKGTRV